MGVAPVGDVGVLEDTTPTLFPQFCTNTLFQSLNFSGGSVTALPSLPLPLLSVFET